MAEDWSPAAEPPEISRRIAAALADRYAGLPGDVRDRIERAAPRAQTRCEVLEGGWLHFWVDVGDGDDGVERGELNRSALWREPPSLS
jgi:hypothetical protein